MKKHHRSCSKFVSIQGSARGAWEQSLCEFPWGLCSDFSVEYGFRHVFSGENLEEGKVKSGQSFCMERLAVFSTLSSVQIIGIIITVSPTHNWLCIKKIKANLFEIWKTNSVYKLGIWPCSVIEVGRSTRCHVIM